MIEEHEMGGGVGGMDGGVLHEEKRGLRIGFKRGRG